MNALLRKFRALKLARLEYNKIVNNEDYLDWYYGERLRLKQFKNIHKGEDCFIIGNGPSINKLDLTLLNDYHTFGMNKIYLIFERVQLDLSYLVSVNPLVIEQSEEQFKKLVKCPVFLSYHNSKGIAPSDKIFKLHTAAAKWSFYNDVTNPISEGFTVTFVAMQLAFYMGFQNVFLIGVDHNFKQQGKANEAQVYEGDDENHFHKDYFKGQQWHLADLEGNEASYALAKHAYHAHGRNIYDATLNGKLNIFEKIPYEEALKIARKKK